jgi:glucose-1-phosphate adenylyltransferase
MINQHIANDADITIMTNPIPDDKVSDLGIVKIDESGRMVDFAEKPKDEESMERFRLSDTMKKRLGIDNPRLNFLASMGNYVFFWDRLKRFLNLSGEDFAKDIIPSVRWDEGSLYAYVFKGYWRDVGKIKDYFNCNMEFACGSAPIDLFKHRIRKHERHLPGPSIAANTAVQNTILSSGNAIRRGSVIMDSVLGYQVIAEEDCVLGHCVLLGADRNEFHDNEIREQYTTRIGKGSNLSYVILDKNVWVGEGVNIGPHNGTYEIRRRILQDIVGLKPYKEIADGTIEGDFYIEPGTGILVIGKQNESDPKEPMLPDGLRC